jgi:hypothetical protein
MVRTGDSSCSSTILIALHNDAIHAIILGITLSILFRASSTGDMAPRSLCGLASYIIIKHSYFIT